MEPERSYHYGSNFKFIITSVEVIEISELFFLSIIFYFIFTFTCILFQSQSHLPSTYPTPSRSVIPVLSKLHILFYFLKAH